MPITMEELIDIIERGTPSEIPWESVGKFHLDALQYWWLHHEFARHQDDRSHIANELADIKVLAVTAPKGAYFARLLGCMVAEMDRHSKAQEGYTLKIGKIVEKWEQFPIADLFRKLQKLAGQWLLIPRPHGEPRKGNDVSI